MQGWCARTVCDLTESATPQNALDAGPDQLNPDAAKFMLAPKCYQAHVGGGDCVRDFSQGAYI